MSEKGEGRRNKKYSNFKESRRPTILAKKDDEKPAQPKILLKSKEKEPVQPPVAPVQINIAVREKPSSQGWPGKTQQSRELAPPVVSEPPPVVLVPKMTRPVDLIISNFTVNTQAFEYLNDNNSLFFVIGVIGMRGVGKSTILNLLTPLDEHMSPEDKVFNYKEGIFPMKEYMTSNSQSDGIQMCITKDRKILLDCSPVLANLQKKDCILSEIDDLKLIMFLLSVCHLVIVVQEDYVCTNLIRLIQNAEMMKTSLSKDEEGEHLASIMFVKNNCSRIDFTPKSVEVFEKMNKIFFQNSKLRIYSGKPNPKENKTLLKINKFFLPKIDSNHQFLPYYGYSKISELINNFRQSVFMTPRNSMINILAPFTEKLWAQLVSSVWESHKNNFFLRKYETLKDKTNLHGHREREIENGNINKERTYYDYI